MNKKGFTLSELLAVIIVLAVISLLAGFSISTMINRTKKRAVNETTESLKDAAVTYALENRYFKKDGMDDCTKEKKQCNITVSDLEYGGYFKDDRGLCGDVEQIIIELKNIDSCYSNNCKKDYVVTLRDKNGQVTKCNK